MKKLCKLLVVLVFAGCAGSGKVQDTEYVRHVILWTMTDELTVQQKTEILDDLSLAVEQLEKSVPGAVSFDVLYMDRLESSNCDFMFDFVFESAKALEDFASNPDHLASAGKIRPYITGRTCLDISVPAKKKQ